MKNLLAALIASAPLASLAVSFSDIQFWAGTGTNQAAVVIDFNDGQSPMSYVWGYRWTGIATGEQAFRAIVEADPHLISTIDVFSFGASINSIAYLPLSTGGYRHSQTQDFGPAGLYWSYWSSTENNASWSFSSTGMTQRLLQNGDVDGWAFSNPNYNAPPPTNPVAAVPEPSSLLSVGIALALTRARRPRRGTRTHPNPRPTPI